MPGTIPAAMDAKWQYIIDNAATLHFSSTAPASVTVGSTDAGSLGNTTVTSGDFSITNGTATGDRKLTMATKEITTDAGGGTVATIQLKNASAQVIHFWDATSKALNGAQAYTVPELDANDKSPVNV